MPYKSKKSDLALRSLASDCTTKEFVESWGEMLDASCPVYRLKTKCRILETDVLAAFYRWANFDPTTPDDPDYYWSKPEKWGLDWIKSSPPPSTEAQALEAHRSVTARAHYDLGVQGLEYRNGRLYRRKRALKGPTEDYSFREAAQVLSIREEEISEAVHRGQLLSSLAAIGRRRLVNRHDLEDWVRGHWQREAWVPGKNRPSLGQK